MNQYIFKILFYIKKFSIMIVLFCLISLGCIYTFFKSKQTYTASVTIEYTNDDASKGYAPDGTKIKPEEIVSSKNISNAMDNLSLNISSDYIRNCIQIKSIIPKDEKEKKEAALQNGEKYEYFATKYKIFFTVDSSKSKEFASDVLNSLLSEYYINYSESHINKDTIPVNIKTLIKDNYDYLEIAEIMNTSVSDTLNYLNTQQETYPDFRSANTGYSFKDLYNEYTNISNEQIPNIFSYIFQNKITKDYELLVQKYKNRINSNKLEKQTKDTDLKQLASLIESYATKSKEQVVYNNENKNDNEFVIKNVEDHTSVDKTTYDKLILQYVDTLEAEEKLNIDTNYCKNVLNTYNENKQNSVEIIHILNKKILNEMTILKKDYKILEQTTNELNEILGAKNIKTKTNIIVNEKFNIKFYMLMAFVVFIIIGCCGAIVLGRVYDIIYQSLYYDKKTGLLNRTKCDQIITDYAKQPINEELFVIIIMIQNLSKINTTLGRQYGDKVLKVVGHAINNTFPIESKLTYNGNNQFLLFIPNSSTFAINSYLSEMKKEINHESKNFLNDKQLEIEIAISNAKEENIYKIRELISKTFQKVNGEQIEKKNF